MALAVLEAWVARALGIEMQGGRLMGVLRMARLLRLVRVIRTIKIFKELYLLCQGFVEALKTLVWVFMLLTLLIYAVSILITILLRPACEGYENEGKEQMAHDRKMLYGTLPGTMYTMFQIMTLESWSVALDRPFHEAVPGLRLVVLAFLGLTAYGMMNIVIGVIVENTIQAAKENEELMVKRANQETARNLEALKKIFIEADEDGSGTMDVDEFVDVLEKRETIEQFMMLDLPHDDPAGLFEMLDEEGKGELAIEDFVQAVMTMRGSARAKDLMNFVVLIQSLSNRVQAMEKYVVEVESMLCDMPNALRRAATRAIEGLSLGDDEDGFGLFGTRSTRGDPGAASPALGRVVAEPAQPSPPRPPGPPAGPASPPSPAAPYTLGVSPPGAPPPELLSPTKQQVVVVGSKDEARAFMRKSPQLVKVHTPRSPKGAPAHVAIRLGGARPRCRDTATPVEALNAPAHQKSIARY